MTQFEPPRASESWVEPGFEAVDPEHVCCHTLTGSDCGIRSYSMCNVLRGAAIDQLEQLARRVTLPPRHQLMAQDSSVYHVYNVTAGMVRLSQLLTDGRRQVIGFALPGDFLGLSLPENCGYSADTLTEVAACQFDRSQFARFLDEQPSLLRRVYALVGKELTLAQEHMALLGRRTADEKVACFLLDLRKRLVRSAGLSDTVPLPMSRQDIADYLGLTIETVSRMLTHLDREGVLDVARDKVRILDLPRLEALAAQ